MTTEQIFEFKMQPVVVAPGVEFSFNLTPCMSLHQLAQALSIEPSNIYGILLGNDGTTLPNPRQLPHVFKSGLMLAAQRLCFVQDLCFFSLVEIEIICNFFDSPQAKKLAVLCKSLPVSANMTDSVYWAEHFKQTMSRN